VTDRRSSLIKRDPVPPPHWEADVVVADGGTVHLRPMRPSDAEALVVFHAGLSERTRYLRYFSAYPRIPERDLYHFTHVDHHDRVAFVALLGSEIIAVGRYDREPGTDNAEVAFVVADAHQGRGIGSVLLEHLAAAARESGIRQFNAVVLAENTAMVRVFHDAGYETARHVEYGEITLEFAVDETAVTETVMREREQRAEARSIERLLYPRGVAVIGASNDPDKVGHAVFANLLRMSFNGPLYPINPEAVHVGGVPAYGSVLDVPGEIDLAVVVIPAAGVPDVVAQCGSRDVRGLVVLSGGFGERGSETERAHGREAQRVLVAEAHASGMRVVGPNCLGIINTDVTVRLNASLTPLPPLAGRAGFFAQSGALGVAVLGEAARRGIGVSTFVSAGSRADVSGNDLLQYWATDERTDVILMYLESFGNPRKFARLARRLGRTKPIVAVNSGAGTVVPGLDSTSVDLPDDTARVLFERSGVIRVDTVGDLFDVALLLTSQPLPTGPRVAVVGNSTALAVLVRNACAAEGLSLACREDVGVDATPDAFEKALQEVLANDAVDAVVAVFVPPLQPSGGEDVALALRRVASASGKPLVSTFLGFEGVPGALAARGESSPAPGSVPSYASPERAVRALGRVVRYSAWRRRPRSTVPELTTVDLEAARSLVDRVLAETPSGRELLPAEAGRLLAAMDLVLSFEVPPESVEVVIGARDDPSFGALAWFGIAGVATELLGDRAYAAVPLTTADAEELVSAPRAAPLLTGYSGSPAMDLAALRDIVLRLSAIADALPELAECTLHVLATPLGAQVASVTARVAPASARADTGPRRLRGF
jgi:acyl-CoA synthetase (NDP forming)/RimJ/RimL family protein N-acetyltransferase